MKDSQNPLSSDIQREAQLQKGRERLAGGSVFSLDVGGLGGSPVPPLQQMQLLIDQLIRAEIPDTDGVLHQTILVKLKDDMGLQEQLMKQFHAAKDGFIHSNDVRRLVQAVIREWVNSEELWEIVRFVDQEWGRLMQRSPSLIVKVKSRIAMIHIHLIRSRKPYCVF